MATIAENLQILKDSTDAIKQAIIDKGGKITGGLSSYADSISKIGANKEKKDVVFYDYDGTVLHTYAKDEFLTLTSLPDLPSHDGLICQEWNWALKDAKSYVQDYGKLNIGATYITNDNKTRLYINLLNDELSIPLYFYQSAEDGVTVEWGDGNSETMSSKGNVTFNHTYNKAGSYTISLTVNSHTCTLGSSSGVIGNHNAIASGSLYKVEIGSNTYISNNAFEYYYSLQSITIPNSIIDSIGSYTFKSCYSLRSITIPKSVTSIVGDAIEYCYSLQSITIPKSVTNISNYSLQHCYSLQNITIPNSIKTINDSVFNSCYNLQSVIIPKSVTNIYSLAFMYCYGMQYYDFTYHTSIPTLSSINAFEGIKNGCEIRVPAALYGDWVNATNWSSYADYIVPIGPNIKYFMFNADGQYKRQYFEEGMTWEQWLNSSYNRSNRTILDIITPITELDLIIEKSVYDILYGAYVVDINGNLLDPNAFAGTADDVTGIGLITDKVKMIVALDEWYSNSVSTAWNGNNYSAWGGYNKTVTGCWIGTSGYLSDFNGESNTDAIIDLLKGTNDGKSDYTGAPAAEYCRAYSKGYKGVGEWYLPAAGEINEIALNKDAIDTILIKLGKDSFSKNSYTWSSSQYNSTNAWRFFWDRSSWASYSKNNYRGVRPVCAF